MSGRSIMAAVLGLGILIGAMIYESVQAQVITTGNIETTNGPVAVIQIYQNTNGAYEVQFNPNNISNGWQTIYTTTNFASAVVVLRRGLASVTNTVQNTK